MHLGQDLRVRLLGYLPEVAIRKPWMELALLVLFDGFGIPSLASYITGNNYALYNVIPPDVTRNFYISVKFRPWQLLDSILLKYLRCPLSWSTPTTLP